MWISGFFFWRERSVCVLCVCEEEECYMHLKISKRAFYHCSLFTYGLYRAVSAYRGSHSTGFDVSVRTCFGHVDSWCSMYFRIVWYIIDNVYVFVHCFISQAQFMINTDCICSINNITITWIIYTLSSKIPTHLVFNWCVHCLLKYKMHSHSCHLFNMGISTKKDWINVHGL